MITSLLNMQQRRLKNEPAKEALNLTKNRVKSIGLIHEHLYRHDDFSKINLRAYVEELVEILIKSLHRGNEVARTIEIDKIRADLETAIPIGLILNELITNSIKYAFVDHSSPSLNIKIKEEKDQLVLQVIDNGSGIENIDSSSGFGHTIVSTLLDSCSGSIEYIKADDSFDVIIRLTEYSIDIT